MQVIYTGEELPEKFTKSLFLAGPSARANQEELKSWREDAIDLLRDKGYDGLVICPEVKNGKFDKDFDYDKQVEWEEKFLNLADCILFWVNRDLSLDNKGNLKLPAFTTNCEYGAWASSGKVVCGFPEDAEKVNYLKYYCEKYNIPTSDILPSTVDDALEMLKDGVERSGGERFVPLFIWKQPSFQSWYKAQTEAGNHLEDAKLLYSFRPGYKSNVFLWILKVKVYIKSEDRYKENEFVLSRPDISSVCIYYIPENAKSFLDYEIIIIKEFRSPASTEDGFIRELPSGSSNKDNPKETAIEEVMEETGFYLNEKEMKSHGVRQLAGTLSAHKSHLFSFQLSSSEINWFKSQKDVTYGKEEDSERTFIEVVKVEDLLENELVDWTCLGQILSVLK